MKRTLPLLLAALACFVAACDETTVEPAYVHVSITSPADRAIVGDSLLHVTTTVERNCGCSVYVEFSLDSTLVASSFSPPYDTWIPLAGRSGEHLLIARAVVSGKAEGRDTVRITIRP